MVLPAAARRRLAQPLRALLNERHELRVEHTLPVNSWAWDQRTDALAAAVDDFLVLLKLPEADFAPLRTMVDELVEAHARVVSLLLSMEPFAPFEHGQGTALLTMLDEAVAATAERIEGDTSLSPPREALKLSAAWWRDCRVQDGLLEPLADAFGMPAAPVDDYGEFRPDRVLQHYAYDGGRLLMQVQPHLRALGVPVVADVLAAIAVIGSVVGADDPIVAYTAMRSFVDRYLAADQFTAEQVLRHLDAREPALRLSRRGVSRALNAGTSHQVDSETQALALADVYRRVAEGPFRQFAWAMLCLRTGAWSEPPTLTPLGERVKAGGGYLGWVAEAAILTGLRNSAAHETLAWDGYAERYVLDGATLDPSRVVLACVVADSFVRGCEAALAAVRTFVVTPQEGPPRSDEPGRMPEWRRAEAYFGTNNLRLTEATLNSRHARVRLERLSLSDINPCFQALMCAHSLLPEITEFRVHEGASDDPLLVVSRDALALTQPGWEYALSTFDRMPFSTFLPANLGARICDEPMPVAVRSAAWIAVDDVLDAVNGAPDAWAPQVIAVVTARLQLVQLSLQQTLLSVPDAMSARLRSVLRDAAALQTWLSVLPSTHLDLVVDTTWVQRLEMQWDRWGPVRRLPRIPGDGTATSPSPEPQPGIRTRPDNHAFRTL